MRLSMAIVLAGLLPVFLLIVLGAVLKRTLMRLETQWHGLERLTYYVLFPMLLIQTLVKADLSGSEYAGAVRVDPLERDLERTLHGDPHAGQREAALLLGLGLGLRVDRHRGALRGRGRRGSRHRTTDAQRSERGCGQHGQNPH